MGRALAPRPRAGAVGYSAGYGHNATERLGDVGAGISAAGRNAAEGVGSLFSAAREGLAAGARGSGGGSHGGSPHVTHIYHDRGGRGSNVTIALVGGGGLLACYYALCRLRGWDFFGLSQQRTQELIQALNQRASPRPARPPPLPHAPAAHARRRRWKGRGEEC